MLELWSLWIKDLFINVSILITLIFIGSQFFMKNGINRRSSLQSKLGLGIIGGISGIVLMNFTIIIPPENTFIDMRNIAIVVTSIYGGPISTAVTAIMLSAFRWIYGGMTSTALIGVITILMISFSVVIVTRFNHKRYMEWIYMFVLMMIITSISLSFIIIDREILRYIILINIITCIIAYTLVYALTEQLERNYHLIKGLKRESTQDFMTKLINARGFNREFNRLIEEVKKDKCAELGFLMLDIDNFKKVNDTYGHNVGDRVLMEIGKVIMHNVRVDDIVARIGGEEFCIILPEQSSKYTLEVAERIRTAIERYDFAVNKYKKINVTISIGCAIYPDTVTDIEKIKEISDKNLYKAKNAGRNRVMI